MSELEEGKITKWLTAPSRKKALAQKMRQHSINILTKNNSYKKAGDVSGEDAPSKDPTGHGRSFLTKGYKETGEKSFSKSSKINYPDSEKHNRPVINNGPKSTAMRKKLTAKYSTQGKKAVDHSQKWWKKANKLNPLEEAKYDDPPFTPDKKKSTPWTSPRRKAKQLAREMMRKYRDAGKKKTKPVSESLKPSQKAVKYLVNKEVKKNSSASGDDFQPTSRSARLLKKLHEGGIKDLVTKDQEEKRLLKTDKPQKVLTDKERAKLKALKKINEAKWGSIDDREPSMVRKDGKITKKSASLLKKKIKANLKGRIPGKNVYDHMKKYENGPLDEAKKSTNTKKKTLSQKDEHDKKVPNSLASYRERIARGRYYARDNDGKLDEVSPGLLMRYRKKAEETSNQISKKHKKGTSTKDDDRKFDNRIKGLITSKEKIRASKYVKVAANSKPKPESQAWRDERSAAHGTKE